METTTLIDFPKRLKTVPTRLEGMETAVEPPATSPAPSVPTRLEGMETSISIHKKLSYCKVPTRLEGMETPLAKRTHQPLQRRPDPT